MLRHLEPEAEHTDRVRGLSRGADDYVTKASCPPGAYSVVSQLSQNSMSDRGFIRRISDSTESASDSESG